MPLDPDALANLEALLRGVAFFSILSAALLWETLAPARLRVKPRLSRWVTNTTIVALDTLMLRVAFPVLAVGVALGAERAGVGLFNLTDLPFWLEVALAVILLDFLIYAQHVLVHRVPFLWRLHRMHHADPDVDVSTALRFHPLEIAFSMVLKIAAVLALGAPAIAVILFEIILSSMALFNHANAALPRWLEPLARALLVTPDMHRIHHSQRMAETNSNYGFNLSIWDRLFGTYTRASQDGPDFPLGLEEYDEAPTDRLGWNLLLPFKTLHPTASAKKMTASREQGTLAE